MKSIIVFKSLVKDPDFGLADSALFRIVHSRYVAQKKYRSPELIGALLMNSFNYDHDEDFFLNSLKRISKNANLEFHLEKVEDKDAVSKWDSVKI
jgi:hypothetical protein